jgi:hypothetical protein
MKENDLRLILKRLNIEMGTPNHSGWGHTSCPFAPWKHKGGVDRSQGFAVKVEDGGLSAFTCPACKSHGRIDTLAKELGRLRQVDYTPVINDINKIEMLRMTMLPPWEQRAIQCSVETLPEPLDPDVYDPLDIFDDISAHSEAVEFMEQRRVSQEAADRACIRFDPDKRRIVFPVRDREGRLYGFTGRTVIPDHKPKVLDYANLPKRMLILGEHTWKADRQTLIVEGLFAYARFLTEGADAIYNVGALLGSEVTPGKAAILRKWARPTHLILDPDPAGDAGIFGKMKKTGRVLSNGEEEVRRDVESGALWMLAEHMPVYVPEYPEGVTDPDDLTMEQIVTMTTGQFPVPKPKKLFSRST